MPDMTPSVDPPHEELAPEQAFEAAEEWRDVRSAAQAQRDRMAAAEAAGPVFSSEAARIAYGRGTVAEREAALESLPEDAPERTDYAEMLFMERSALEATLRKKPRLRPVDRLRSVVEAAANDISAREKDGSFLETTLRDAIAERLPGEAVIEWPLRLSSWNENLGPVDILYRTSTSAVEGIETKVWDVDDALFDLFKLSAATQQGRLNAGYLVIAGRSRDWRDDSAVCAMSVATHPGVNSIVWSTERLLRSSGEIWAKIWSKSAARPAELPRLIRTFATRPIPMAHVPDHEVRVVAVISAGDERITINRNGQPAS